MYLNERYERYKEERKAEIQQDLDEGYIDMEEAHERVKNILSFDDYVDEYNERNSD